MFSTVVLILRSGVSSSPLIFYLPSLGLFFLCTLKALSVLPVSVSRVNSSFLYKFDRRPKNLIYSLCREKGHYLTRSIERSTILPTTVLSRSIPSHTDVFFIIWFEQVVTNDGDDRNKDGIHYVEPRSVLEPYNVVVVYRSFRNGLSDLKGQCARLQRQ